MGSETLLVKLSGTKVVKKPRSNQGKFFRMSPELQERLRERSSKLQISEGALMRMAISRFLDEDDRREERL